MLSSGKAALLFLLRVGGNISKDTSGGIESGALPIFELHLGDEMNVRREVMEADGWVFTSRAVWRQRQRALGNMAVEMGVHLKSDEFLEVRSGLAWLVTCNGTLFAFRHRRLQLDRVDIASTSASTTASSSLPLHD